MAAMAQEVPYITVKTNTHSKQPNIENLTTSQKKLGFPVLKKPPVEEYITIPFPDFSTLFYEITIWAQYQTQMNSILEKIFYNYDYHDSFVMWSEFDEKTKKGNGYRFVGFRDGNVTPQSNVEEFSDSERVIKYVYTIKVPAYLILDPKDEAVAYGRNNSTSRTDDNSKVVYKSQNAVELKLKETIVSEKVFDQLQGLDNDVKQEVFRLINAGSGGGGGSTGGLILTTIPPPNVASTSDAGNSIQAARADHTHGHGDLARW